METMEVDGFHKDQESGIPSAGVTPVYVTPLNSAPPLSSVPESDATVAQDPQSLECELSTAIDFTDEHPVDEINACTEEELAEKALKEFEDTVNAEISLQSLIKRSSKRKKKGLAISGKEPLCTESSITEGTNLDSCMSLNGSSVEPYEKDNLEKKGPQNSKKRKRRERLSDRDRRAADLKSNNFSKVERRAKIKQKRDTGKATARLEKTKRKREKDEAVARLEKTKRKREKDEAAARLAKIKQRQDQDKVAARLRSFKSSGSSKSTKGSVLTSEEIDRLQSLRFITSPMKKSIVSTNVDGNHMEVQIDTTKAFTTSKVFNDRSEMIDWAKKVGRENGVVVVTTNSHFSDPKRQPRMFLGCERGGKSRDHSKGYKKSQPKCQTLMKRCGCPFKLRCVKLNDNEDKWLIKVLVGVHNHELIKNFEGHSYFGRLLDEEYEIVRDMTKSGVSPKDILSHLKGRDSGNSSTISHIYNAIRKNSVEEACGYKNMQPLSKIICNSGYMERHRLDPTSNRILGIFWAHPTSVDLVKAFPFVFMMDCTYKASRYRLPLLEIVGVTSTDKMFSAALVYVEAEKEENYTWALECFKDFFDCSPLPSVIVTDQEEGWANAVTTVFPSAVHLFSRMHIERNVLTHCRKYFSEKEKWEEFFRAWTDILLAETEDKYESKLYDLERAYEGYPSVLTYVRDTLKFKHQFVSAWADRYLHFGITSTCIESSHAKLKKHLCSSVQNLVNSWNTIKLLLEQQISEIKASFEQSLSKTPRRFSGPFFREVIWVISIAALEKIQAEIDRSKGIGTDPDSCNHIIHKTLGLPCAHMITQYKREGRILPLSDIHPFWKKLSTTPFMDEHTDELDILPEVEMLYKNYKTFSDVEKLKLKKHLKMLSDDPAGTLLLKPMKRVNVQGRQKTDSKRQDISELLTKPEPLPSSLTRSSEVSIQYPKPVKLENTRQKLTVQRKRNSEPPILFISALPAPLSPFITNVTDVPSDGHCGFRVVAEFLGLGEYGWRQVRHNLLRELDQRMDDYTRVFYGAEHVAELRDCLRCQEKRADPHHWMKMPDMGHLIASCYNIIVVHISKQQCLTFLPLWVSPRPPSEQIVLHIGFVNSCHFIRIHMAPDSPIPPVARVWEKFHNDCASDWHTPYMDRIEQFRKIAQGTDVALIDVPIDID